MDARPSRHCRFHFYRGAPIDGAIFLAVGIVLALEASGLLRLGGSRGAAQPPSRVVLIAGAACAVILAISTPHSAIDGVVVVVVGIAARTIGWPDDAIEPVVAGAGGRAILVVGWLFGGYALLRRGRHS